MLYNDILMRISLYLARVLNAYTILIWVRIIFSWFVRYPQRTNFVYWMGRLVDPYLSLFKRKGSTIGRLDFSPLAAVGVLYIFEGVFEIYGTYGTLTLSSVLYLFIVALWNYGLSIFFWILFFALVFRLIASYSRDPARRAAYWQIGSSADSVVNFVQSFARRRPLSEKAACWISLALVVVFYFMTQYLLGALLGVVTRIPF